ncbi:MAG: GPW/gp25 family protein [candidate division Zixibacteria bacterium]|nr:GPW/gp25 family protein [candidate division Zixibacteria bacterium]
MEYLSLPLVLREGYLPRTDLRESITYSIGLLLSTRVGSMPFNPEYGCDLWDKEFSDLYTSNKADIRANLRNAIGKFEKRLYNVSVSLIQSGDQTTQALGMGVKVTGNYLDDNEEMKFEARYDLG